MEKVILSFTVLQCAFQDKLWKKVCLYKMEKVVLFYRVLINCLLSPRKRKSFKAAYNYLIGEVLGGKQTGGLEGPSWPDSPQGQGLSPSSPLGPKCPGRQPAVGAPYAMTE